jgi:hypothetical protein
MNYIQTDKTRGVSFSETNSESMEAGYVETVAMYGSTVPVILRQEFKILIALSNQNS